MIRNEGFGLLARLLTVGQSTTPVVALRCAPRLVDIPVLGRTLVDFSLDFTAQTCLRTNLGTKRALEAMAPSQIAEIWSDNVSAVETIPFMLDGHACEHLCTVAHNGTWVVYVRKAPRR